MWGKHLLPQAKHTLPTPAPAPEAYVTGTALVRSGEVAVSALPNSLRARGIGLTDWPAWKSIGGLPGRR